MNNQNELATPTDAMFRQAAQWATRAESGRFGSEDFAALEQWLSADRRHLQAFKRMQGVLNRTDGMPLPTEPTARARRRETLRRGLRWLPVAAALGALALLSARVLPLTEFTVETAPGEIRTVSLGDGSTLTLRGDTALRVDYGWSYRTIELQRGEAAFDVAHHRYKPFVVRSNSIQVVAIGTAFNVDVNSEESTVTLVEGRVDVGAAGEPVPDSRMSCRAIRLNVGERVAYRADGTRSEIEQANLAQVTAWQDGRIVLERRPLEELVSELDRAYPAAFVVDDPAAAAMTVNVSIRLDEQQLTLERLERQLPIKFTRQNDGTTVVSLRNP